LSFRRRHAGRQLPRLVAGSLALLVFVSAFSAVSSFMVTPLLTLPGTAFASTGVDDTSQSELPPDPDGELPEGESGDGESLEGEPQADGSVGGSLFTPLRVPGSALPGPPGEDGAAAPPEEPLYLVLNVAACRLYVYLDARLHRVYPTTVGRPGEETPTGEYSIISKRVNPTWYPDDRPPVPPGPANPLGTRWMGFTQWGHGLHGTNTPWLIGRAGSGGCVRLRNAHAEELFEMVRIGTPVKVVYEPVELALCGPEPDDRRQFVLSLFPDIYGRIEHYGEFLEIELAAAGIEIDKEMPAWLVEAVSRHTAVTWDTATPVMLGSRRVETDIIRVGREDEAFPRIWIRPFGEALGLAVGWNHDIGAPTLDGRPVEGCVVAGGRAYAGVDAIAAAAGIRLDWVWESLPPEPGSELIRQRLSIYYNCQVFVDGRPVSGQAFRAEDGTYVPLRPVADALRLPIYWDAVRAQVVFAGVRVPATIIDGVSYLRTQELAPLLVVWAELSLTDDGVFINHLGEPSGSPDEPGDEADNPGDGVDDPGDETGNPGD